MMRLETFIEEAIPFAVMAAVEIGDVFNITLSKAAMNLGMNNLVFVVYYNALGILILLPPFIFHRYRNHRPPLTFSLLCKFSLLGLLGICLLQVFGYAGINYSSPTLATAMGNLIPAFTFLLAVLFRGLYWPIEIAGGFVSKKSSCRMEKFDITRVSSQAKSLGTIIAISGAFVMTLYKGPPVHLMDTSHPSDSSHHNHLLEESNKWILGGVFLGLTCIFSSAWNIAQTAAVKEYPDATTVVFFYCFFGTLQCTIFALWAERSNPTAWTLQPGIQMIAIAFSAVYVSVFRNTAMTWCLNRKGPVYVAMFKPTQMVIAVIFGSLFLGDTNLYLGSAIGGTIIGAGFYIVMWGQTKEDNNFSTLVVVESSTQTTSTPLLPS